MNPLFLGNGRLATARNSPAIRRVRKTLLAVSKALRLCTRVGFTHPAIINMVGNHSQIGVGEADTFGRKSLALAHYLGRAATKGCRTAYRGAEFARGCEPRNVLKLLRWRPRKKWSVAAEQLELVLKAQPDKKAHPPLKIKGEMRQ